MDTVLMPLRRALSPCWGAMTLLGVLLGACYWLAESGLHAFVFREGGFWAMLLPHEPNEWWMRGITVLLFIVLGGIVQWHQTRISKWTEGLRQLARAVEHAGEAVLITDAAGRIEFINPAFTRFTGYTLAELRGQNPSVLKSGAHTASHYRTVWSTIASGQVWSGKVVDRRKDGSFYPARLTIAPVTDVAGRITHYVGVQHDMTQQVELEERARHAEKPQTLGTFAGGIAHDFGNVLGLLILQTQIAETNFQRKTGDVAANFRQIDQLLEDANRMVQELRGFARRDRIASSEGPLDLCRWVEHAHPTLRLALTENVQLSVQAPTHPLWVQADGAALRQALINLVQNACDAIADRPEGQIAICLQAGAAAGAARAADIRLTVRDNGPGIDSSVFDRIFEPFFTTKGAGGTGLGLAMAKDTVERFGGTLRASNPPGGGALFEIVLPSLPPMLVAKDNEQPAPCRS